MANFRKLEVKAFTRAEAEKEVPFKVLKDTTQAYKKAGEPKGEKLQEFMAEQLRVRTKNAANLGCVVVLSPGSADTREKPYKIEDVANTVITGKAKRKNPETGEMEEVDSARRKYKTTYTWIDDNTGEIVHKSQGTKAEAKKKIAELYQSGEYKGDATCFYTKEVVEGEPRAATAKFTPSKTAKEGVFMFYGIEL